MNDLELILGVFLTVDALALLVLLIFKIRKEAKRNKVRHYGDRAEKEVAQAIQKNFPGGILINDLFLKTRTGTTQVDHILLCKWGIFVIETKSHNGRIDPGKREWLQLYQDKAVRFHSPLLQNRIHCKALQHLLSKNRAFSRLPVNGVVVFTSKKVYFTKQVAGVVRLEDLDRYIKNGGTLPKKKTALTAKPGTHYLTKQKIEQLEQFIRSNSVHSHKRKRRHERMVRSLDRNW